MRCLSMLALGSILVGGAIAARQSGPALAGPMALHATGAADEGPPEFCQNTGGRCAKDDAENDRCVPVPSDCQMVHEDHNQGNTCPELFVKSTKTNIEHCKQDGCTAVRDKACRFAPYEGEPDQPAP